MLVLAVGILVGVLVLALVPILLLGQTWGGLVAAALFVALGLTVRADPERAKAWLRRGQR
jgi:hypothetical protein